MTDVADSIEAPVPDPADPRREYVAGSAHWLSWRGAVRALPHALDDLERELGDDLYARMLTDPRVRGDVGLLKANILKDGISITPCVCEEEDAAGQAIADEAAAFVQRCLDHLQIPLSDVLDDLLDALAYGAKVAEQVYGDGEGIDAGRLVLKALKPKPRKLTAFVVDAYCNVLGLLAAEPGRTLSPTTLLAGQQAPDNMLPRSKFAVLTHKPKDSDPRGTTILRAAYNWWWIKYQFLPEWLKTGMQFGTPSLVGITEEHAQGDPEQPSLTPEQLLLQQLLAFQGGTALALRYGSSVSVLESERGGADNFFAAAMEICDRQISTAIYGATRATQEAQNGSRADSDTAKDLFDSIVDAGRLAVATMLQRDVIPPLLALNNAQWAAYPPVVGVGGIVAEDRTPAWNAVAGLERSGYLDPSQYQELDAQLGLPVRTPEEVELRRSRKAAPPIQPPPVPGQMPGQQPPPSPAEDDDDNEEGAS